MHLFMLIPMSLHLPPQHTQAIEKQGTWHINEWIEDGVGGVYSDVAAARWRFVVVLNFVRCQAPAAKQQTTRLILEKLF